MRNAWLLILTIVVALPACTPHVSDPAKAHQLERALDTMLGRQESESRRIAQTAVYYTRDLARRYDVQPPAVWHNFLVNAGARQRGLCCHWTRDLMDRLIAMNLVHYELHWGVAYHDNPLEHSGVVVTPVGGRFEDGILLDGWRDCGDLHWSKVEADRFPWIPHPDAKPGVRIECK